MNILIAGINSAIGSYICNKLVESGNTVCGTYRSRVNRSIVSRIDSSGGQLFYCDFSRTQSIEECLSQISEAHISWDIFISTVGILKPVGPFANISMDQWESNVYINSIGQMRFLQGILPFRANDERKESAKSVFDPSVFFMVSKGINDSFSDHSAYCISKLMLVKMVELLDDEIKDCKFIAVNPGFIKTEMIKQDTTVSLRSDDNTEDDLYNEMMLNNIYNFICWAYKEPKRVVSGRTFFAKYDKWQEKELVTELTESDDKYKLRRCGDSREDLA